LKPDYVIEVNGFSLGGSLAQLVSMQLLRSGIETKVIAMAGYRIGDADFAEFYNEMTTDNFRVANHQDFGVHLMPSFLGYKHTGTEFYLEDDTVTMHQCDGSG